MPKVSVLIPTYNTSLYIEEAIESVLNQTYTDFELIIVDNCSTDNTREIVAKYLTDKRVTYHVNEKNLGPIGNFNQCLSYANGAFIKFLCADDKLNPTLLQKFTDVLETQPHVVLVSSFFQEFDPEKNKLIAAPVQGLVPGPTIISAILNTFNFLGCPSQVMIRKEALKGKKFREMIAWNADLELFFRILSSGDCYIIPEVLSYVRLHFSQTSQTMIQTYSHYFGEYELVKLLLDNQDQLKISGKELREILKKKAAQCTLSVPRMLLRIHRKGNRNIIRKAMSIAFREKAFGDAASLYWKRIFHMNGVA